MKRPLPAEGPWVGEPDFLEFDHAGFHCIIQRTPEIGILCGYVAIPEGHPWHREVGEHSDVDVHGGITYARDHAPHSGRRLDVLGAWWIGFDTGHAGDFAPGVAAILGRGPRPDEVYKDLAYVRAETERLAEQAKAAACP